MKTQQIKEIAARIGKKEDFVSFGANGGSKRTEFTFTSAQLVAFAKEIVTHATFAPPSRKCKQSTTDKESDK